MPRGFQHAHFLLTRKCFMPPSIASEPLIDTCQGELENDTEQHEPNDDRMSEEHEDSARESRNSPEYPPASAHLTEEQEISLLGNNDKAENNDQEEEVVDDGQIIFALDDEDLISRPYPSLGATQSSELTYRFAVPYEDESFDEQDEFDLGL